MPLQLTNDQRRYKFQGKQVTLVFKPFKNGYSITAMKTGTRVSYGYVFMTDNEIRRLMEKPN